MPIADNAGVRPLTVSLVSFHTSPLDLPGRGDAGGLNVQVLALADTLTARGHRVSILTRRHGRDQPERALTPGGAEVLALPAGPLGPLRKEQLPKVVAEFSDHLAALPTPDVIHSHYWLSGLAAQPVAAGLGIPHVLNLHTVVALKDEHRAPGDSPESPERCASERMLTRSGDTVAGSERERDAIIRHYGPAPERVHHIPPGVDTDLFSPARAANSPAPLRALPHGYLAVLGRVQPLKGQDLAIRLLAALPAAARPDLVLAGEPTLGQEDYATGLRALATSLGVAERVHFLPARSRADAAALLAGARLALVPSHSETFGLVALEAAASGTPVLAQRTTGLIESISDGESGILCDGRDPETWAREAARLLDDPTRLDGLSRSARDWAHNHSWEAHAARVEDLYARLAGATTSPVARI
ncbi:glycosyltransferase [Klugiella xanthotipulae]|uniref:glycosyltransferase n=1 Tax=Klugiella xanthotipulae TaxID=244735 RepID=UPI001476C9D2|nr:glycosyltransferase [Klugiella xanthotipulae]